MNVSFDYSSINVKVIQSLSDGMEHLNTTINKCSQLVVPGDFQYAYFLNNLGSDFSGIYRSLSGVRDYLYCSDQEYESLLNDLTNQANSINNIMIDSKGLQIN